MPCNYHILIAISALLLLNFVIDPCCARRNKQRSNSGSAAGSNSQVHHPILAPASGSDASPSLPIGDSLDDSSISGKTLSFAAEPSSQYVAFDHKKVSFKCSPRPKTATVTWLFNSKPLNESYFSPYLKVNKFRLNIQLPKINPTANDDSGNSQAGHAFNDAFSHNNNNGYGFDPSNMESSLQKLTLMRSIMAKLEGSIQCLISSPINKESLLSNPVKILIATLESFPPPMATDSSLHPNSPDSPAANVTHVVNYIEDNTAVINCNLPNSVPIAVAEYLFTPTNGPANSNSATGSSASGTILIDKSTNVDKYLIMPSGALQILSIKPNDSGIYECVAHNPLIGEKKKSPTLVQLKVRKRNNQSGRNFAHPKFTSIPKAFASSIVGSNLTLECAASSASPGPTITWSKVNGTLPLSRVKQVAGNLIINSVEKSDEGAYICSVEPPYTASSDHRMGKMEARSIVSILEPVRVSITKNLVTSANRFELAEFNLPSDSPAVIIQCTAKGNPRPNIYWVYNGVTLNDAHDFGIYSLTPASLPSNDASRILVQKDKVPSGLVQCFAANELGTVYDSVKIWETTDNPFPDDLYEPSSFNTFKDEEPETLGVHSSGRDDLSVGGSSGSRNNGDFDEDNSDSDTASNGPSNGRSRGNNNRGRPRPGKGDLSGTKPLPTKPIISRLSNDSVMVRWNLQPGADESQIEFYKIQYKEYKQPNQTGRDSDSRPHKEMEKEFWKTADDEIVPHLFSHTITGLDPNSTYRFRVAIAYKNEDNAHGPSSGRFTLAQDTHVKRLKTVPIITSLVPLSPSALEVKWIYNHPLTASTPVEGFIVYYRETTTAVDYYSVDVPGTMTRSHVLSHLLPATAYEVKIVARNSAGTSNSSDIITNSTLAKVDNLQPTLVTTSTETPPKILTPISSHDAFVVYLLLGISAFIIILVTVVFFTLCVVKQKQPTGQSTSSSSSSGSASSSHRLRHPSNTRSIDRNSLRGSPIHSSYSLRRDKLKYGKERHPKAHSLHNLHQSMSKLDYGNSYNNYIKTATINKNAINGTLTKSMNGLAFRSETTTHSGFVYQGNHDSSDTELSDKMSEIRITVNPQFEPESVRVDMSDRRNGLLTTATTTTTTTAVSRGRNSPRVHLKNSTFRSLNRNASFKSHQSLHHVAHHHQHTHQHAHQYQVHHHTLNHGSSGHRSTATDQYTHGVHPGMNGMASNMEGISPRSDFSKKSAKSAILTLDRNNRNTAQANHGGQLACETVPNHVLNSNNNNNNNNRSQYLSSYAESPLSSSGPGSSASSTSANVTSGGSSSNGASSDNCGDGDGTLLLSRCSTTHNTASANGPLVIMQSSC